MSYETIKYADDLNAFREYPSSVDNNYVLRGMEKVQYGLHVCGKANGVRFDATKESFHILLRTTPYGGDFKHLGITFDPKLSMHDAVHECVIAWNWKLQSILRSKKCYNDADIIITFKAYV